MYFSSSSICQTLRVAVGLGDRRRLVRAREAALVALAVHLDVLLVLRLQLLDRVEKVHEFSDFLSFS